MSSKTTRIMFSSLLAGSLFVFAGCFMTKYTLIAPEQARVDRAFVGDWNSDSFRSEGREAGLIVRNIDDKLLYMEWATAGSDGKGQELTRAVGFTTELGGATFAQLRGLQQDGKIDDDWMLVRLDLAGDRLTIRQLKEDFFKNRTIESSQQLRQVLQQNLNSEEMYAKDEQIVATRVVKK